MTYESECFVFNEKRKIKIKVVEMRMLRWISGEIILDRIRNKYIKGNLEAMDTNGKWERNKIKIVWDIEKKNEDKITKKISKRCCYNIQNIDLSKSTIHWKCRYINFS